MMKFGLAFGAIAALVGSSAHAQMVIADTDGDGVYSMEELLVSFPGLTEKNFVAADTNGDRSIGMEELAAAVAAGQIPL